MLNRTGPLSSSYCLRKSIFCFLCDIFGSLERKDKETKVHWRRNSSARNIQTCSNKQQTKNRAGWESWHQEKKEVKLRRRRQGSVFRPQQGVCLLVQTRVRPCRLQFTLPLFLHHIKETICLINARVCNPPASFKSMHKRPHRYNRDIDLYDWNLKYLVTIIKSYWLNVLLHSHCKLAVRWFISWFLIKGPLLRSSCVYTSSV